MPSAPARNLGEGETRLKDNEQRLLDQICESYYLPAWCSLDDYRRIFEAEGLQVRLGLLGSRFYSQVYEVMKAIGKSGSRAIGPTTSQTIPGAMGTSGALAFRASSARVFMIWTYVLQQDIKTGDWSEEVAPFWEAVMWSALSWEGVSGLFRAGWKTIKVWVNGVLMQDSGTLGTLIPACSS